jgi:hypothetical protein
MNGFRASCERDFVMLSDTAFRHARRTGRESVSTLCVDSVTRASQCRSGVREIALSGAHSGSVRAGRR